MDHEQLWNLFRETGDPVGYLLYRAEARSANRPDPAPDREQAQQNEQRRERSGADPLL